MPRPLFAILFFRQTLANNKHLLEFGKFLNLDLLVNMLATPIRYPFQKVCVAFYEKYFTCSFAPDARTSHFDILATTRLIIIIPSYRSHLLSLATTKELKRAFHLNPIH